ncbi:WD40 repeat domain-containing protein [Streptomyces sp. SCL15-6]|uniref:WD40 repeat domain-containing protein n=1 Tax=Streptomyces sp. SCL15-6 TaxID=2967222 RepID=UPI0029660E36|nr:WD40 repeat domain-containing protein [Streptomyces sp. SCL15-6]
MTGRSDTVRALAWSWEGRLATGAEDGTIRLWDTRADVPARRLPLRHADDRPVTFLSSSTAGREVAAVDGAFTVGWPFSALLALLGPLFAGDVHDEDVAGYAGGAQPADGCP